ncbi:MAG: hypothetical protein PHX40_01875 [Bacilli bacterium]|nr:hypothetical protein [Bacilli bacterium]
MNSCSNDLQHRIIDAMDEFILISDAEKTTVKDLENYVSLYLGRDFTFISVKDNFPIATKLKEMFGIEDLSNTGRSLLPYSNILKNVSSFTIDDLFHGIPYAKAEFEGYSARLLLGEGILGKNNLNNYALNNKDLNDNFKSLKNNIFEKIQKFLKKNGWYNNEIKPLYTEEDTINYSDYINIMNILNSYFFNNPNIKTITSYTEKKVPDLSELDIKSNRDIFETYYDMIILSNFDSVINTRFKSFFKVNINKLNLLDFGSGENLKYSLLFDPKTSLY